MNDDTLSKGNNFIAPIRKCRPDVLEEDNQTRVSCLPLGGGLGIHKVSVFNEPMIQFYYHHT